MSSSVRASQQISAPTVDKDALLKKLRAVKQRLDSGDVSAIAEAETLLKEAVKHD